MQGKKTLQNKAVAIVRSLLTARRNGNVKQEQVYHEKLVNFCSEHGFDFEHVFNGAEKVLKRSIAAMMNGIV